MTIETLVGALVTGVVIGALGRLVVPGRQPIGCLFTILVGIVGARADRVRTGPDRGSVLRAGATHADLRASHQRQDGWRLQAGLDLGVHSKT